MTETVKLRLAVEIDVAPAEGQTLEAAAERMRAFVTEYLTEPHADFFMRDYGATIQDVRRWHEAAPDDRSELAAALSMPDGGYEGPWAVDVTVTRPALSNFEVLARLIADLNGPDLLDDDRMNAEYLRGQIELAVNLIGYSDDGFAERNQLMERVTQLVADSLHPDAKPGFVLAQ